MRMLHHGLLLGLLLSQAVQGDPRTGEGQLEMTTRSSTDPESSGTKSSVPRDPGDKGTVCIPLHFLIPGAVGIGLVSAVISFTVSCLCMRGCKGRKKKEEQEDDEEVSIHYASLQNLPQKEGDASRGPVHDGEKRTCYASLADIKNEFQPKEEKDMDGVSLKEIP